MAWSNAITEVFKFLNNIFWTPKRQIEKVINIYDAMHEVLEQTSVQRILIYKAHNGGGVIKSSGELYVSALYEDYTSPFKSMKWKYQKVEVDEIYARMLLEMIQKGIIHLKTGEMQDSLLKGIHESEHVKESRVYFLRQTKKYIFFCSCDTSHDWLLSQSERTILDLAVQKIKQNIK